MPSVTLDFAQIHDWDQFHAVCQHQFGFPDFYGRNMNAWIDCLTYMTDGGDGISRFVLSGNEVLTIHLLNIRDLNAVPAEILEALHKCARFVNDRYITAGDITRIKIC